MWLVALILGLPLIEISLFVTVGAWIGLWGTLGIVLGTAVLGIWLIRTQGDRARRNLRKALEARTNPVGALASDVLVVVAGALLVLPGFFTDACGLVLLLPPVQHALTRYAAQRARSTMDARVQTTEWSAGSTVPSSARHRPDQVIDTTWEELPPDEGKPPSGWTRH